MDRIVAARAGANGELAMHSTRRLPERSLTPGLSGPNVLEGDAVRQAIADTLSAVGGGGRSREVIAVLPDAAVRLLIVEFDSLPTDHDEAAGIVRFRLKKSVPFDVEQAAFSFQIFRGTNGVKVVAALSPRSVIHEYESAFEDSGFSPGVVLPSVLATLGLVEADSPTMLVKIDPNTTTIAIANGGELLLLRTLDLAGRVTGKELADHIHPSMVFFEDTHRARIESIALTGMSELGGLANELQAETGTPVTSLAQRLTEPDAALSGVAGALA